MSKTDDFIAELSAKNQQLKEQLAEARQERDELRSALEESVKLQAHYAVLLNMHDGGSRMPFDTVEAWMDRLREIKRKRQEKPE